MRFLILLYCFIPCFALAQSPLQWKLHSKKIAADIYQLQVQARLQKGWYAYDKNSSESIEAPSIQWDNEVITTLNEMAFSQTPQVINDRVYSKALSVYKDSLDFTQTIRIKGPVPAFLPFTLTAYLANGKEFLPVSDTVSIPLEGGTEQNFSSQILLSNIDLKNPVESCGDQHRQDQRLFATVLLGFLGGLIALFTPCVFPMIPVTISFFTGKSKNRQSAIKNGIWYGTSIFLIYLLVSLPFHLLGNIDPQIFNTISTNAGVNIFFFIVFIVFALSFFGWFEITLPSSVSNLAGSKSRLGSAAGIFFMALTLAIVSFSCTGPILGSLLVGSISSNGAAQLTAGMAGFGLALGLPFALFAMFPQWLSKLPKSGSWMDVVKKSLAFVELALAIKFLSNADLVQHWGILKREIFIGLWMIIALALSLYLFGVFEKKRPTKLSPFYVLHGRKLNNQALARKQRISNRLLFGVIALIFALYLIPGIIPSRHAKLSLLSGFPPPLSYSIYGKKNTTEKGLEPDVVNDYQKAILLALKQNKPLLVDFTGWACVNCRKMEENVWPDPKIREFIKQKFILLSLYVDDRKKLPSGERFVYKTGDGQQKTIVTIGDKYATLQAVTFKQATQPMYAIISPDEKLLNNPVGYTPSVAEYGQWLQCGYNAFAVIKKKKIKSNEVSVVNMGHP